MTFDISLPAAERLATGIGVGVLYDPTILHFVDVTNSAPDLFQISKAPELVDDPPRLPGQTAMLRLTWVSPSGQWSPALDGGPLAQLTFSRLSSIDTQIRVVSLTADASHAIQPMAMRIAADAAVTSLSLDPREVAVSTLARTRPLALPAGQCTPDVDGNDRVDALTDGIILIRYLFGFTGSALTSNAIGVGATRSTPEAVKAFIDQSDCLGLLDIDQNGRADALTDGILLVRQLFGFSGDDLVTGALPADAERTSADALRTTIQSYAIPRDTLVNNAAIGSGASMTDAGGDFTLGAVGGNVNVTLVHGTDYDGNRTLDVSWTGTGDVSVVVPPAQAGPPAAVPASTSDTYPRIGTLANVASFEWKKDEFELKWFYKCGAENRLPESVHGATRPVVSSQPCLTSFNRLHLAQYPPARLYSSCSLSQTSCYQSKSAVLFVHGFTAFLGDTPSGGGTGTWGNLPALVKARGMVPFEFQWITAARFDDAATELRAAIETVARETGRPVHVVAHSFGGLLVRALLQSSAGAAIAPSIASVVSLGTPHSGIALAKSCPGPASVPIPAGSDTSLLGACQQISCYQGGFDSLPNINNRPGAAATLRTVYELDGDAGYLIGRFAQNIGSFPAVDWLALIGIVSRPQLFASPIFGTGDDLITYEGQRFLPSMSLSGGCPGTGVNAQLSTNASQGAGKLWERVLGFTGQPAPGGALTTSTDPNFNGGYTHNGGAAFAKGDSLRTKREANVDCTAVDGCLHDTVRYLFGTSATHSFFNGTSWIDAHPGTPVVSETMTLRVTILDAATRQPIPGAIVSIYRGTIGPSATTNAVGQATLTVPFSPNFTYDLRARATGYVSMQDTFVSAASRAATPEELGIRYLVPRTGVGTGTLAGTVQNATTGAGIANATVTVRRSDRQILVFSGTTAGNGTYNAGSLAAGTYIVTASASGFLTGSSELTVFANTSNTGNLPLSPQLTGGQARIVLTWGTNPRDLDSHLRKGRANGTTEYHIYYLSTVGTNGDNLDVDDVTSFGPETVTIQNIDPTARYTYWVDLFAGTGTIASSPTRVTLTTSSGTTTFNAPSSATGRVWVVFDIVNGQVVPCTGSCSVAPLGDFESRPAGGKTNQ